MEAVEEDSMVLEVCKDYQLTYPMVIDTEASCGNGRADLLDKSTRTLVCKAFCETIASAGHKTGVYASKNWLLNNIDVKELEQYFIWLAEYKEEPTYQGKYHMWQKTSHGYVDGVPTRVDLNISYQKEQ